ncbi:MAG: hypothetical protein HYY39_08010 [Armatimonadetes bacterium]|nr:hypothetical protein [Armatimonadota bacterium]
MAKKVQVVLDDETYRLLEKLAHPRAGNKSFVVREALRYFADRESVERVLDAVLARREAREAMEAGIAAWKRGALVPHERATQGVRRKRAR